MTEGCCQPNKLVVVATKNDEEKVVDDDELSLEEVVDARSKPYNWFW